MARYKELPVFGPSDLASELQPVLASAPSGSHSIAVLKFADIVSAIETADPVDNADQNVMLMKLFRKHILENGVSPIPHGKDLGLFRFFLTRTAPKRSRRERRASLSCLATMAGAYRDPIPRMVTCGYEVVLDQVVKRDEDHDDPGLMRQIFRGIGNVVDGVDSSHDIHWLIHRIGWNLLIQRANFFIDKPKVFGSVVQCFLSLVKNMKWPLDCYRMVMPLFASQMAREITTETCASRAHRFAIQAVSLILVNVDISDDDKRDLVLQNRIDMLIGRYLKVPGITNEHINLARIVPSLLRWRIESAEELLTQTIALLTNAHTDRAISELVASISDSINPEVGGRAADLLEKVDLVQPLIGIMSRGSYDLKMETGFVLSQIVALSQGNNELMGRVMTPECVGIIVQILDSDSKYWSDACQALNVMLNCAAMNGTRQAFVEYLASLNCGEILEEKAMSPNSDISSRASILASEISL